MYNFVIIESYVTLKFIIINIKIKWVLYKVFDLINFFFLNSDIQMKIL